MEFTLRGLMFDRVKNGFSVLILVFVEFTLRADDLWTEVAQWEKVLILVFVEFTLRDTS